MKVFGILFFLPTLLFANPFTTCHVVITASTTGESGSANYVPLPTPSIGATLDDCPLAIKAGPMPASITESGVGKSVWECVEEYSDGKVYENQTIYLQFSFKDTKTCIYNFVIKNVNCKINVNCEY
ncbi:MAG: hypothetical protein WCQ53_05625 [bacterium]